VEDQKKEFASAYNKFINGLQLKNIRLLSSHIDLGNVDPRTEEGGAPLRMKSSAESSERPEGFAVVNTYRIDFQHAQSREDCGFIECTLLVEYDSAISLTDELFKVFCDRNLGLNTWPYFREFVQNTVCRAGLPPLILPVLKSLPGK